MKMQWAAVVAAMTLTLGAGGCRQAPPADTATPAAQARAANPEAVAPAAAPLESAATAPADTAPADAAAQPASQPAPAPAAAQPAPAPRPAPAAGGAAQVPPQAGQAAPSPGAAAAPGAAPASAPAAAPPAEPAPAPEPEYQDLTVPAGTTLSVVLDSSVSSNGSNIEDTVRGHLANSVRIGGVKALPAGSKLVGTVVDAKGSGKVKGRARIAIRFDRITAHGEGHSARTSVYAREAEATKGEDAKKIGIGAGAGAIVGGIIGGGKGAAIGAGVGGGAGTGAVLATKGKEVALPAGSRVTVRLEESVQVRILVTP